MNEKQFFPIGLEETWGNWHPRLSPDGVNLTCKTAKNLWAGRSQKSDFRPGFQKRLGRDFFVSIYSIHHYINLYHIIKEHLEVQVLRSKMLQRRDHHISTAAQHHVHVCRLGWRNSIVICKALIAQWNCSSWCLEDLGIARWRRTAPRVQPCHALARVGNLKTMVLPGWTQRFLPSIGWIF